MQNEKCIMHNDGVPSALFNFISEGNKFILHFAFYILHLPEGQLNDHLAFHLFAQEACRRLCQTLVRCLQGGIPLPQQQKHRTHQISLA